MARDQLATRVGPARVAAVDEVRRWGRAGESTVDQFGRIGRRRAIAGVRVGHDSHSGQDAGFDECVQVLMQRCRDPTALDQDTGLHVLVQCMTR